MGPGGRCCGRAMPTRTHSSHIVVSGDCDLRHFTEHSLPDLDTLPPITITEGGRCRAGDADADTQQPQPHSGKWRLQSRHKALREKAAALAEL